MQWLQRWGWETWKRLAHWRIDGQEDFFSLPVPPWAEGPEEGQGCLSRRQCDLLWAGQGTGRGKGSCPLASQLTPSPASPFSGGRGGTEGPGRGSRAREGPHPLSSVHLAGLLRSGDSFPSTPWAARSEGLAALSPNFKGGPPVAVARSRTSLSGHWGGQSEDAQPLT